MVSRDLSGMSLKFCYYFVSGMLLKYCPEVLFKTCVAMKFMDDDDDDDIFTCILSYI